MYAADIQSDGNCGALNIEMNVRPDSSAPAIRNGARPQLSRRRSDQLPTSGSQKMIQALGIRIAMPDIHAGMPSTVIM